MAKLGWRERTSTPVPPPTPGATDTLRSLRRYPSFRLLLIGTTATNSAFWMYQVAAGWLALEMTDSPFFVGMTGFAGGIPLLLFSLVAGVVIDRFDRRRILLVSQCGVMIVAALFAILVGTGAIQPWSLLLLAAAYGTVMSFIFPTRSTIVASLVDRHDLANAVALNAAGQNATRVVGPSLAGVLIATIGVSGTFAVASLMQILALFTTAQLPSTASVRSSRSSSGGMPLLVGLRVVRADPFLTALMLLALAANILIMPYVNLMPVFTREHFGLGSAGLGLLLASAGVGSVTGALLVARFGRLAAGPRTQVMTAAAFATLVMAFAVTPNPVVAATLLFGAGTMNAAFLAINQTALQLRVTDNVRGRVLSIYLLTWGMLPIGQLAVGTLANRIGAPAATVVACSLALGGIAAVVRSFPALRATKLTANRS